jgi:hypothetical protein
MMKLRDHRWVVGRSYHIVRQTGRDSESAGLAIASRWEVYARNPEIVFDEPVEGAWASDYFGVVVDLSAK